MDTKLCTKCGETKPVDRFANKNGKPASRCKACHNEYYHTYWKNTEAYEKHKARVALNKAKTRSQRKAKQYGITPEQYELGINGPCELCLSRPAEVVDHCHETGRFRGFLCQRCNLGLGALGDSAEGLRRALHYLESGVAVG